MKLFEFDTREKVITDEARAVRMRDSLAKMTQAVIDLAEHNKQTGNIYDPSRGIPSHT